MTTYERGKEPHGAPVTWRANHAEPFSVTLPNGDCVSCAYADDANAICRAFHLAKLAEEAAAIFNPNVFMSRGDIDSKCDDWLRRYREATR